MLFSKLEKDTVTEIITSVVMTLGPVLLLAYWFRYSCLLMVSAKTARDYGSEVALAHDLSFVEIQSQLRDRSTADFDRLSDLLDRDYAAVTRLSQQAAAGEAKLEQHMLAVYYRFTRAQYRLGRRISPQAARRALEQMSLVVSHFANAIGESAAAAA